MPQLQWGVVISASLVAAAIDLRTRRIPNLLTAPAIRPSPTFWSTSPSRSQVIPIPDAHHNLAVISAARGDDARAARERAGAGETGAPDAKDTGTSDGDGP